MTDIVMPKKEGLEFIFEIRKEHPDVKIIAMSANANYLPVAKTFGADRTFLKTFEEKDNIIAIVKDVLES